MLLLILLFCSNALAQSDSPHEDQTDAIFYNIDKSPSRIPTRLLLESGFNLVQIDELKGTITPSNQVNFQIWNALLNSLYTANVDVDNQIQSFDDIQTIIAQYPEEQIQLPILRVKYNTLKPIGVE